MKQKNTDKKNQFPVFESLDLTAIDTQMLDFWKTEDIFKKSVNQKDSNKPFVFFEGPPSANGMPGIHHVIGRTVKDIFCRYKTMQGFQVKRKAGWDAHGLPVELKVEKELGITKEDIGTKISVEDYNKECRKTVMQFKDIWEDLTNKMGYWVDMEKPYTTYDNEYIESVWWALSELYQKDLMYKGYTIQPFSPAAGTGLSTHELNQPGCYKDVTDTTCVAQFKIKKDQKSAFLFENNFIFPENKENEIALTKYKKVPVYFIAWTTTPWTLPSNTALAVGKNIDYVKVATYNPYTNEPVILILAKKLLSKWGFAMTEFSYDIFKDITKEVEITHPQINNSNKKNYAIIQEYKGSELAGINYEQLLPYHQPKDGDAFKVIIGDFVTTEDGTGIVHIAPSFGADDMKVATLNGIGSLTLVDKSGKFVAGMEEFSGRYVKDYKEEENYVSVDIDISIKLKTENKAFNVQKHVHSYPHCWRTDKPILYYPLDSWFIKTTAVKDKLIANNNKINWKPAATGSGRFGNWLENLMDWNLSRSRFWGIPLPIWRTEDGEEEICIGSIEELNAEMEKANDTLGTKNEALPDFHKPYIDRVTLVSPSGKPMKREEEVIDVWFDSGSMPFAQKKAPNPKGESGPGYHTARKSTYDLLKVLKQKNVDEATDEEKILWELLRNKKLGGYKFRRQHIIDDFIVDFVCVKRKLIVEVDGGYHNSKEQKIKDQERTNVLESIGFRVIRFKNEEIVGDIENVLNTIENELKISTPPSGAGGLTADFIAEGVDQTRGWFFTLHAISTMLFDRPAYKNVIANGLVQDEKGRKMSKRLGNTVDAFETLGKYGADATRWYIISNAQPWDNLKFSVAGIEEVKRKFFGTLYNTYSFFSLYANIDNFQYKEADIAIEKRPEIDQWVISCLNTLIIDVEASLEAYEPTNATRLIDKYVDEILSNWYVRLCRRRFWKGEYSEDKISAYQTLYTNLEVLSKLIASVAPFFADFLFQALNKATGKDTAQSVHLAAFPKGDKALINKDLEERMDMARNITSMVLSIRAKEKLKVRQPLQRILIPVDNDEMKAKIQKMESYILSEVNIKKMEYVSGTEGIVKKQIKPNFKTLGRKVGKNMKAVSAVINTMTAKDITEIEKNQFFEMDVEGENIRLEFEDFMITATDLEGWTVNSNKGITVALDTKLTEELLAEGDAREFINRVQNIRKSSDFNVTDKILIKMEANAKFETVLTNFKDYICTEVLASDIVVVSELSGSEEVDINGNFFGLELEKV